MEGGKKGRVIRCRKNGLYTILYTLPQPQDCWPVHRLHDDCMIPLSRCSRIKYCANLAYGRDEQLLPLSPLKYGKKTYGTGKLLIGTPALVFCGNSPQDRYPPCVQNKELLAPLPLSKSHYKVIKKTIVEITFLNSNRT